MSGVDTPGFQIATFEVQAELDTPPQAKLLVCKRVKAEVCLFFL